MRLCCPSFPSFFPMHIFSPLSIRLLSLALSTSLPSQPSLEMEKDNRTHMHMHTHTSNARRNGSLINLPSPYVVEGLLFPFPALNTVVTFYKGTVRLSSASALFWSDLVCSVSVCPPCTTQALVDTTSSTANSLLSVCATLLVCLPSSYSRFLLWLRLFSFAFFASLHTCRH